MFVTALVSAVLAVGSAAAPAAVAAPQAPGVQRPAAATTAVPAVTPAAVRSGDPCAAGGGRTVVRVALADEGNLTATNGVLGICQDQAHRRTGGWIRFMHSTHRHAWNLYLCQDHPIGVDCRSYSRVTFQYRQGGQARDAVGPIWWPWAPGPQRCAAVTAYDFAAPTVDYSAVHWRASRTVHC